MTPSMHDETLLLGIDGGGTKTETWLAASVSATESTVIGRGAAGPANPQAVGLAQATENLDRSVAAAFDAAGRPRQTVRVAVLNVEKSVELLENASLLNKIRGIQAADTFYDRVLMVIYLHRYVLIPLH